MCVDKYKFYCILCFELILWPILWLKQRFKCAFYCEPQKFRFRRPIKTRKITVGIHEWGGYPLVRYKTIKNGATFECGLAPQIQRFANKDDIELIVTISDAARHDDLQYIGQFAKIIQVDNAGMDFSGYEAIYNHTKTTPNHYIILTNSSVNSIQEEFLGAYIDYLDQNPEVGMLGVSYCTKMIQTLIRNNFTPHLQSFFLITTTDVLREVIAANNGKFPGAGIDYKLLLIRHGEIRLSQIVQRLGYRLAVVNPIDGKPYKFTVWKDWRLPKGDIRQKTDTPNRITPLIFDL